MVETFYSLDLPCSLALLGDLHGKPYQKVTDSLRRRRPDLIAIAGDVINGSPPEEDRSPLVSETNVLPFLEECNSIAPTFLSLGNHEWLLDEEDLSRIRSAGVTVLDNHWIEWKGMVIGGLTSAYATGYRQYREKLQGNTLRYPPMGFHEMGDGGKRLPELQWLSAYCAVPGYHILLSHHPEYYPLIPKEIQLILSAHAHGGQWRIPAGVWAPGQGWRPKWTKGVYDRRLVVTTGLANMTRVPRIFNPTEVVYLRP